MLLLLLFFGCSAFLCQASDGNSRSLGQKTISGSERMCFRRNSVRSAKFSAIKNKPSAEADVIAKDSVNVETVENRIGNKLF